MQMLVAPYVEAQLSADARAKFHRLYAPHSYTTQAVSPPFDRSPRVYTFWLEDGLSAGGVSFRQSDVGGACLNPEQFAPGVILWDAGKDNPGVGWISVREIPLRLGNYLTSIFSTIQALAALR